MQNVKGCDCFSGNICGFRPLLALNLKTSGYLTYPALVVLPALLLFSLLHHFRSALSRLGSCEEDFSVRVTNRAT